MLSFVGGGLQGFLRSIVILSVFSCPGLFHCSSWQELCTWSSSSLDSSRALKDWSFCHSSSDDFKTHNYRRLLVPLSKFSFVNYGSPFSLSRSLDLTSFLFDSSARYASSLWGSAASAALVWFSHAALFGFNNCFLYFSVLCTLWKNKDHFSSLDLTAWSLPA